MHKYLDNLEEIIKINNASFIALILNREINVNYEIDEKDKLEKAIKEQLKLK